MLARVPSKKARVGVFAVAHGTYWHQFPGLLDNMKKYHEDLITLISKNDVEIVDMGIVDDSTVANEVAVKFNASDVDVIFYVTVQHPWCLLHFSQEAQWIIPRQTPLCSLKTIISALFLSSAVLLRV